MTKIKKIEIEEAGGNKMVKVTLEKDKEEYVFYARATDVLDEKKFKSLLKYWNEKAIPEKEAEAGFTEEQLKELLKKKEGKNIE